MKQIRGFYFPEDDIQLGPQIERGPTFAGKGTFQFSKLATAMPHIHDFRHALDIGAHVGTWSWPLSRMFSKLTAFEPLAVHRECYVKNVPGDAHCEVKLFDCALGDATNVLRMRLKKTKSSTSYISADGDEVVRVAPLDTFNLTDVDFIKMDVEGFETAVVKGGEQTIRKWKPTMVVEQKPDNAERQGYRQREAVEMLAAWGAAEVGNIGNDIIMRWKHR